MIDHNATHEQVLGEEDRLNAAYDAKQAEALKLKSLDPDDPARVQGQAEFQAVQNELAEFRVFWRSIGHMLDRGHDYFREMYAAPAVRNNDGSAS